MKTIVELNQPLGNILVKTDSDRTFFQVFVVMDFGPDGEEEEESFGVFADLSNAMDLVCKLIQDRIMDGMYDDV